MRPDLFLRAAELESTISDLIAAADEGYLPLVDDPGVPVAYLEEPGRRIGVLIAAGNPRNALARAVIIDAATAVANTPGGGALLIGVEDSTGQIIGTELDDEYLVRGVKRARITAHANVHEVCGQRVVSLVIAPSRLPLSNSHGVVTWRVGGEEKITDRFTWWQAHGDSAEFDPMAAPSDASLEDARGEALVIARGLRPRLAKMSPQMFIRHIGAVHANGRLSQAGKLLLCPLGFAAVAVEVDDTTITPDPNMSVLEQLKFVESHLNHLAPQAPVTAYHEALLNGLVHRDWSVEEPTVITFAEHALIVTSPGGFHGDVTPETAVGRHDAKSPALTDLFRELHLLDKQVSGINRMVYRMIFAGYAPPTLIEVPYGAGLGVQCIFDTGRRDDSMVDIVRDIVPADRAFDHRLALLLYYLRRHPTITARRAAELLSVSEQDAWEALRAATQTSCGGKQLVVVADGHATADAQLLAVQPELPFVMNPALSF
ncbi:DUF5635 domain-containing protein [Corynebacterium aquilae]|uniref:Uncharacterized protein n=1 Tax=Corynebacterium aquilae DSM 44791 TaxID=1431546 RepID=A0A1L7CD63_9CORY|nr:DUF5635 domain-containing protein [Corynebacterium aquilae]APT83792.1 hypothetical protein CAQU_00345 [Corynebacterium aquilae DSM 44791]